MFCVMFLIVAYGKYCYRPEQHHQNEVQGPQWIVRSSSRFSGIDRAVVESLPFFRFSSLKGSKEGLECAVCLSVFEDSEILRLLPRCRHAFHMNCINKWLESHSSCPLCRYRFDAGELRSLACTNSFRNLRASTDEPNLEFYLQREQSQGSCSRFNMVNTFQKLALGRKEEPLIREFNNKNNDGKHLHSVRHKVIVSDVMYKSRWSDVNSSDLMSLNSQMLDFLSSKRFSSVDQSVSGRFTSDLSGKEQILKIKEDIERKRLYEYKVCTDEQTPSASRCNESDDEIEHVSTLKALDPEKINV